MATYYFLNTDNDNDWNNPNNWYNDAGGSSAANLVPSGTDDAVVLAICDANTGTWPAYINNLQLSGNMNFNIVVNGLCTISNYGYYGDGGTLTGNVVVSTDGEIGLGGPATINGNVTVENNGVILGTSISISGNLVVASTFTGSIASSVGVSIGGNLIYNYGFGGTVSTSFSITGNTLYANYPALYFYESSSPTYDWNTLNGWWVDNSYTLKAASIPSSSQDAYIRSSIYFNTGSAQCKDLVVDVGGTTLDISVNVSGTASFSYGASYGSSPSSPAVSLSVSAIVLYDNSSLRGNTTTNISGDQAYFYNNSYNEGIINGNITINDTATNIGSVYGNAIFNGGYNTGYISGTANVYYPVDRNTFNTGSIGSFNYSGYPEFFYLFVGTWYYNSGHNTAAAYTPGGLDDVVIEDSNANLSGYTFNNAILNNSASFYTSSGSLTINNTITFNSSSSLGSIPNTAVVSAAVAIFNDNSFITSGSTLTTSNYTEFNNSSSNIGSLTPSVAVFRDSSSNTYYVGGNAEFYDVSTNSGTVTGDAIVHSPHPVPFDGFHGNTGSINGTLSYSGYSNRTVYFISSGGSTDWANLSNWWTDSGATTQADYVPNADISLDNITVMSNIHSNSGPTSAIVDTITVDNGDISIDITCNSATFIASSTFGSYYTSAVLTQVGNPPNNSISFQDLSINYGVLNPSTLPVIFQDNSQNWYSSAIINGNVEVYYPVSLPIGGIANIFGTITYINYNTLYYNDTSGDGDGDWNNPNNWFLDTGNTTHAGSIPTEIYPGVNVVVQHAVTTSSGGSPTAYNLNTQNTTTYIDGLTIIVNNLATFSEETYLNSEATINGNVLFENLATNRNGIITGTATFTLSSAETMINIGYGGTYGNIEFKYEKGINGSSILGIV